MSRKMLGDSSTTEESNLSSLPALLIAWKAYIVITIYRSFFWYG